MALCGQCGRRIPNIKCLLIGSNYLGTSDPLPGCIRDVYTLKNTLQRIGFPNEVFKILLDDVSLPDVSDTPTRRNIIRELLWLTNDAQKGDIRLLYFAGHGSSLIDSSGDEEDGFDEVILPCDYETACPISDDLLYKKLVKPLPAGSRLYCILDSCYSGTMLDLPYMFDFRDGPRSQRPRRRMASADVVMISSCSASQTSSGTIMGGMFTNELTNILNHTGGEFTSRHLLWLHYTLESAGQTPQVSSTKQIELQRPLFSLGKEAEAARSFQETDPRLARANRQTQGGSMSQHQGYPVSSMKGWEGANSDDDDSALLASRRKSGYRVGNEKRWKGGRKM